MGNLRKPFKTRKEQIRLLKKRRLIINNEKYALEKLKRINYFDLINGFESLYLASSKKKNFPGNYISFDDFIKFYEFDQELENRLLFELLKFETQLKTSIAYNFSKKHCVPMRNTMNYTVRSCYVAPADRYLRSRFYNFRQFRHEPNGDSSYVNKLKIDHSYINSYQHPPFWVSIKAYELGTVILSYSFLKLDIRKSVLKDFNLKKNDDVWFLQMLWVLKEARNLCAHKNLITHFKIDPSATKYNNKVFLNRFNDIKNKFNLSQNILKLYDILLVLKGMSKIGMPEIKLGEIINCIEKFYLDYEKEGKEEMVKKILKRMGNENIENWKLIAK